MNKFKDNKNYDASTSVTSVVIGSYIVYVYMYPICYVAGVYIDFNIDYVSWGC